MSTEPPAEQWIGRVCVQQGAGLDPSALEQIVPLESFVASAAELALSPEGPGCTVRIVTEDEVKSLNSQYRSRDKATNVLSFPSELSPELAALLPHDSQMQSLGDIALCLDVAVREAVQQGKAVRDHVLHLIVHGVLHLRGFDHITDAEATTMEALEVQLLATRGVANPYHDTRGQTPDSHG